MTIALVIADAPPTTMIGVSLSGLVLSCAMVYFGRRMIRTRTAPARKLERLWSDEQGMIRGRSAVLKGYVILVGGVVLTLSSLLILVLGGYTLLFGPIR